MSGSSNQDSFRYGRQVAVQLVPCGVLSSGLVQYCSQHSCVVAVQPFLQLFSQRPCSASIQQKQNDHRHLTSSSSFYLLFLTNLARALQHSARKQHNVNTHTLQPILANKLSLASNKPTSPAKITIQKLSLKIKYFHSLLVIGNFVYQCKNTEYIHFSDYIKRKVFYLKNTSSLMVSVLVVYWLNRLDCGIVIREFELRLLSDKYPWEAYKSHISFLLWV